MLWEGLGFLQQIGESFGIRPKANSKRVEQTGCWCLPGPRPAGPGCYLARPGQFRNRETTLLKIWIRPAVCPKSCKLECKREHKKRTTVLLSWSTNPTTNSKNQHKKKHKLEHKKSTRTPQLFCNPEHKPDHKLQEPAQEKHNCFAIWSTRKSTNWTKTSNLQQNPGLLSKMIKRYQAWGGPGGRWEAQGR